MSDRIEAAERPIHYVCDASGALVAAGTLRTGDVLATAHVLHADADENALLGALTAAGVSAPPLPDAGEPLEQDDIYEYGGTLVMVRKDTVRVPGDPLKQVSEFGVYQPGTEAWAWVAGEILPVGSHRVYDGVVYELYRDIGDANWSPPPQVAAHWRVAPTADEWPEWVQPTGAHDAYNTGDQVTHNGQHWINTVPEPQLNSWEPGVHGWELVT